MKLGLKANYVHVTTTSSTTNGKTAVKEQQPEKDNETVEPTASTQTGDVTLNSSFDSSDNYVNFNKNQHEPFKYPSSQIYLYPAYMQRSSNHCSFDSALLNQQKIFKNSKYESNFSKTGKMSKIRRFTLNYQQQRDNASYDVNTLSSNQFDVYKVELKFADCTFDGEGQTLQMAKHDAASKALSYFTDPNNFLKAKELSDKIKFTQAKNTETQAPEASCKFKFCFMYFFCC
jgi:hypothetical protein